MDFILKSAFSLIMCIIRKLVMTIMTATTTTTGNTRTAHNKKDAKSIASDTFKTAHEEKVDVVASAAQHI